MDFGNECARKLLTQLVTSIHKMRWHRAVLAAYQRGSTIWSWSMTIRNECLLRWQREMSAISMETLRPYKCVANQKRRFSWKIPWLKSNRMPSSCSCRQRFSDVHIVRAYIYRMMSNPMGIHKCLPKSNQTKTSRRQLNCSLSLARSESFSHLLKPKLHSVTVTIDVK